MNKSVSIIVPTHNRSYSLKRLLDCLSHQTYPLALTEAIIVADGCIDETMKVLQQYRASFKLRWIELPGLGAAAARNSGAETATGEIFIFLDDDIEPSLGLVEAHVAEHQSEKIVAIGYLPLTLPKKASFHQINLTSWWEQKYFEMKNKYYRYNYEDLLSGNFSINAKFFKDVRMFDSSFKCREDYELGARLIQSGADFVFSTQAWGYHRDESTDFPRLLRRRRDEGRSDVLFARKHPDLLTKLRLNQYQGNLSLHRKVLLYSAFDITSVGDYFSKFLLRILDAYEKLKKRQSWDKLNRRLNDYWYIRGLADELKTRKAFSSFIEEIKSKPLRKSIDLNIDLKAGIPEAEKQIDLFRPDEIQIRFRDHFIGEVKHELGVERLRGKHLKPILVTYFPHTLTHALMVEEIIKKPAVNDENKLAASSPGNTNNNDGG